MHEAQWPVSSKGSTSWKKMKRHRMTSVASLCRFFVFYWINCLLCGSEVRVWHARTSVVCFSLNCGWPSHITLWVLFFAREQKLHPTRLRRCLTLFVWPYNSGCSYPHDNWSNFPCQAHWKQIIDCTLIIDRTEIRTEMSFNRDHQHALYSHYKVGYTVKFLVGVVTNGMIAFISWMYGRHTSDCHNPRLEIYRHNWAR